MNDFFSYLDYGDYLGDGQINFDKVTNLVSNGKYIYILGNWPGLTFYFYKQIKNQTHH